MMRPIYNSLLGFLRDDGWPIHEIGDGITISTAFEGESGGWVCVAQAVEDAGVLIFYSILPVETPPERRDLVAAFLCYASYGVPMGNFEISHEDGDVRFKTAISVVEMPPQVLEGPVLTQLIKNMVYTNVLTMEEHIEVIQAVISGQEPPSTPES